MQLEKHRLIDAPYAWKGADLKHRTDWLRPFSAGELAEIDAALQSVKRRGIDLFDIAREDFPLPTFSAELAKIAQELETGRGMIMLRGLPLSYSPDDLRTVYWGIGAHLGTAVSQNKTGELLGVVKDFGGRSTTRSAAARRPRMGCEFHSDRCDVVGLLCVRKAKSGGASRIVSSAAIHNEILRRRPDLIDVFYDDWVTAGRAKSRRAAAHYSAPDLRLPRRLLHRHVLAASTSGSRRSFPKCRGTRRSRSRRSSSTAQLAERTRARHAFRAGRHPAAQQPPDVSRPHQFVDYPEESRKRLLLRLWLSVPASRPLPEGYEVVFGRTRPARCAAACRAAKAGGAT